MTNYIVSGLERSGTSMMMQILYRGGMDVAFDEKRKPDDNNPKGYFELEGGKVINRLMDGSFPMEKYDEKVIKVTAYGLKFLPPGEYRIIYMTRNIEEILASMAKMSGDPSVMEEGPIFERLNRQSMKMLKEKGIPHIIVRYNDVLKDARKEIERVDEFLGGTLDVDAAMSAVDPSLYRNRKEVIE